ncbi:MAG: STAS domain-containing protein [Pseudomonadota bacterium]|nr:STAS domain-containing protein [Pseudomonadota bacterium]
MDEKIEKRLKIEGIELNRWKVSGDLTFNSISDALDRGEELFFDKNNNSLRAILSESTPAIFDLSEVRETDSAGLSLLIEWIGFFHKENIGKAIFENIPKQIHSMAEINEILPLLDGSYNSESKNSSSE